MQLKIKLLYEDSIAPWYAHATDSGMDLTAHSVCVPDFPKETILLRHNTFALEPQKRVLVKTGIAIELPFNTEAQIRSRSGLAWKNGIFVLNSPGTIDEGYRDEIGVILYNSSSEPFEIQKGDRIAQMVITPVIRPSIALVGKLEESDRGLKGFGSTGI